MADFNADSGSYVIRAYTIGDGLWDAIHDAETGSDSTTFQARVARNTTVVIGRGFIAFDTSGLPEALTISAASISLYVTAKVDQDDDGSDHVRFYQSSQVDPHAPATSDYHHVTTTAVSDEIDIGSITTSALNVFNLNAGGIALISTSGYTYFCFREGHDVHDDPIANGTENSVTGDYTQSYLSITYTSASASPSVSPSASPSPSVSPSVSPSSSPSPSVSPSVSPSTSPSPSLSPSSSPSLSPSASPSVSPSISPSVSPSVSPSLSPSASPSVSPSASPSIEWTYEDKSDDPTWAEKDKSSSPTWTFKDKNA